jgi:hypothetical protein
VTGLEGVLLATGLPPGWIEVGAHASDDDLRGFLQAQMDADADAYAAEQRQTLVEACLRARHLAGHQGWLHLGCVVTQVPAGDDWISTAWSVGVGVVRVPDVDPVDPLGVVQRGLPSLGRIDSVHDFTLADGREGVYFGMRTVAGSSLTEVPADQRLPQLDPDDLGMYVVLLPVAGLPGVVGVTVGVAPNVAERGPMSFLAGQMAASLHVVDDPRSLDADLVLVDPTRQVQPRGYLR